MTGHADGPSAALTAAMVDAIASGEVMPTGLAERLERMSEPAKQYLLAIRAVFPFATFPEDRRGPDHITVVIRTGHGRREVLSFGHEAETFGRLPLDYIPSMVAADAGRLAQEIARRVVAS